jgi:hypothetical protein
MLGMQGLHADSISEPDGLSAKSRRMYFQRNLFRTHMELAGGIHRVCALLEFKKLFERTSAAKGRAGDYNWLNLSGLLRECFGRGGGDRTKSDVETLQVVDSNKRGKREKSLRRLSGVHARYTTETPKIA